MNSHEKLQEEISALERKLNLTVKVGKWDREEPKGKRLPARLVNRCPSKDGVLVDIWVYLEERRAPYIVGMPNTDRDGMPHADLGGKKCKRCKTIQEAYKKFGELLNKELKPGLSEKGRRKYL
jgi:hypothetical protein